MMIITHDKYCVLLLPSYLMHLFNSERAQLLCTHFFDLQQVRSVTIFHLCFIISIRRRRQTEKPHGWILIDEATFNDCMNIGDSLILLSVIMVSAPRSRDNVLGSVLFLRCGGGS